MVVLLDYFKHVEYMIFSVPATLIKAIDGTIFKAYEYLGFEWNLWVMESSFGASIVGD
jgi:hypothetical protein